MNKASFMVAKTYTDTQTYYQYFSKNHMDIATFLYCNYYNNDINILGNTLVVYEFYKSTTLIKKIIYRQGE